MSYTEHVLLFFVLCGSHYGFIIRELKGPEQLQMYNNFGKEHQSIIGGQQKS